MIQVTFKVLASERVNFFPFGAANTANAIPLAQCQFDINVGKVIASNMPRVTPPKMYSRKREWP